MSYSFDKLPEKAPEAENRTVLLEEGIYTHRIEKAVFKPGVNGKKDKLTIQSKIRYLS